MTNLPENKETTMDYREHQSRLRAILDEYRVYDESSMMFGLESALEDLLSDVDDDAFRRGQLSVLLD